MVFLCLYKNATLKISGEIPFDGEIFPHTKRGILKRKNAYNM